MNTPPPPEWNADGEPLNLTAAACDAWEWLDLYADRPGSPQNLLDARDALKKHLGEHFRESTAIEPTSTLDPERHWKS